MDNHPIPQDVTHFQFRLIGDMTLKQFGYVAGGVIFAWVALASPLFFLIKVFLAGCCILAAIILAFLPIDGRPSDVMLANFIKAIFSPTQFIYKKTSYKNMDTKAVPVEINPVIKSKQTKTTFSLFNKIKDVNFYAKPSVATAALPQVTIPKDEPEIKKEEELKKEEQQLTNEISQAQKEPASKASSVKLADLEKELQKVLMDKKELEDQLLSLQKSAAEKKEQVFTPSNMPEESAHVRKIPKQMGATVGAPLVGDVPNLITGIIKDSRGNVLSNILIEVKDKDGNPVRAFKTNQLGQFQAATPLYNGIYTISFEDPASSHTFDSVEITASGNPLSPLEIISIDAREKLRQELFGKK